MASLGEHEYESLGRRVVASLSDGGGDLNQATANVAEQEHFNPDQIRRLVEFTNTAAFLHRLEGAGGATPPNPAAEFEPAQPSIVIRLIIDRGGSVPGESAAPAFDDITSSFPAPGLKQPKNTLVIPKDDGGSGEAEDTDPESDEEEEEESDEANAPLIRASKREAAHRALDRVLEQVVERHHRERMAFDVTANDLYQLTRRRPQTVDDVEKVAYALHANEPVALEVLRHLRQSVGLPALDYAGIRAKQAAAPVTFHMTPTLQLIDELVKHAHAAQLYKRAEEYLREHL